MQSRSHAPSPPVAAHAPAVSVWSPELLPAGAAVVAMATGLLALAGWALDIPLLRSVLPHTVEMKANTAVGLLASGGALLVLAFDRPARWRPVVAQVLASFALVLGLATLSEYLLGLQLGIDELLFRDTGKAYNVIRGRMSPYSAVGFSALGLGLLGRSRWRLRWLPWVSGVLTLAIGAVAVIGYAWRASELVTDKWAPPVALNTGAVFMVLGSGLLIHLNLLTRRRLGVVAAATGIERRFLAGFGAALLLLSFAGALTYRGGVEFERLAKSVVHTQQVRSSLSALRGAAADAEAAQLRYLLGHQPAVLDDHMQRRQRVKAMAASLIRRVTDNPGQRQQALELAAELAALDKLWEDDLALDRAQGMAAVQQRLASQHDEPARARVHAQIEQMDATERALLAERQVLLTQASHGTLAWLLLTLGVAVVVFAVLQRSVRAEMSARVSAQAALVAAREEADAANRAKSVFLATMSHEIRTPLNGLLGMVELLGLSRLDAAQRSTVAVVRESGAALLRIINDILDFSKIEAGKLAVEREPSSVSQVALSVRNLFAGNASAQGLVLSCEVDPQISPVVLLDPLRLRQVLSNLVGNAIKFTPRGGTVAIVVEFVERRDGKEWLRFAVRDSGIGMSAQQQQLLFQPFHQLDAESARRYGGTGLGLTISQRLVAAMDGSIGVESESGKGTVVHFTLPVEITDAAVRAFADDTDARAALHVDEAVRAVPDVAAARANGTLLLVVDDHPVNRAVLSRQLEMLGYASESVESGEAALDAYAHGQWGVVLTDCNMPGMDGYALTRAIRQLEATEGRKRTPIIATTANALAGEAANCFAAGMDDYLAKPFDLSDLQNKVGTWLAAETEPTARAVAEVPAPPIDGALPPFDPKVLAGMPFASPAEELEILQSFRSSVDADVDALLAAVAGQNLTEVARRSHRMRGASATFGALPLSDVCKRIEQASRAADAATVAELVDPLQTERQRLGAYLDNLAK